VVWIASHLHFPERIVNDHWIKHAANLIDDSPKTLPLAWTSI
jgi:predicted flap endonuclease-1-like 5' DNA nuclease